MVTVEDHGRPAPAVVEELVDVERCDDARLVRLEEVLGEQALGVSRVDEPAQSKYEHRSVHVLGGQRRVCLELEELGGVLHGRPFVMAFHGVQRGASPHDSPCIAPTMGRPWGGLPDAVARFVVVRGEPGDGLEDPLRRHAVGRPQGLGEEGHSQLLDHPADLRDLRRAPLGRAQGLQQVGVAPLDEVDLVEGLGVPGEVGGSLVEAVRRCAEIAVEVRQP